MTHYNSQQPESIQHLFSEIAHRYDRCNQIMSLNMHRRWNQQLINLVVKPANPQIYVDLCAGTGDIALRYLQTAKPAQTYLIDFCAEMLEIAKYKANKQGLSHIQYLCSDAQMIPLEEESVDCITIAYGIRNVAQPSRCLVEAFRILRPGGCFGLLELTRPAHPLIKLGHAFYLKAILPLVGRWITSNQDAYKYLCNSIQSFISVHTLHKMLEETGFQEVKKTSLLGGIATILSGIKVQKIK